MMRRLFSRWSLVAMTIFGICCASVWFAFANRSAAVAQATTPSTTESVPDATAVRVETTKPQQGGIPRTTTQPGTVIAFESAQLFAKVSGYLKTQAVDIGDHVRRGQVLAEIDSPEMLKAVDQAKATVDQTQAQVTQADARILTAEADQEAAAAAIVKAQADVGRTTAAREFRQKQYKRISELFRLKSVDERLVDEQQSEAESAVAAEHAAIATDANSKAGASAAAARVAQAKADAVAARANVEVAQASLAKAQVFVQYLEIRSPYDGVVTKRSFFRGDFIRSADQATHLALLAVDRTDLMRVIVQVPDRDVPLTNPGDEAVVEIDALPGVRFSAKVARIADAEDSETALLMQLEIDLPNDQNLLRQGMYGLVTIQLASSPGALTVPSSSLVGVVTDGKGSVFVVKDGVARLVSVRAGRDNGLRTEVFEGLSPQDDVIFSHNGEIADGTRVSAVSVPSAMKADAPTVHH